MHFSVFKSSTCKVKQYLFVLDFVISSFFWGVFCFVLEFFEFSRKHKNCFEIILIEIEFFFFKIKFKGQDYLNYNKDRPLF